MSYNNREYLIIHRVQIIPNLYQSKSKPLTGDFSSKLILNMKNSIPELNSIKLAAHQTTHLSTNQPKTNDFVQSRHGLMRSVFPASKRILINPTELIHIFALELDCRAETTAAPIIVNALYKC